MKLRSGRTAVSASTTAMKLRSGRTTVATPSSFADGESSDDMKASLWGELQSFIDLSMIYAKLPLAPFFRLRQVCKEWNRLASDRQFLEQNFKPPISNIYFVVARRKGHRLWTSQDSSSWTSWPLPRRQCEVSGLLYEDSDRNRVFDLHTRVFYSLPPLPPQLVKDDGTMVGMTVDTTLIPYGFRVFITSDLGTSIYNSNSGAWTWESTNDVYSGMLPFTVSSIHYNKFLYIFVKDTKYVTGCFVRTYDLENHVWAYEVFGDPQSGEWEYGGIGMWRDRWFAFGMKPRSVLTVWQTNTHFEDSCSMFDCMPKDLWKWMMRGLRHQIILVTFCGEHVLVYNCFEAAERAVLYNLDRKTWEKIELSWKH